MSDHCTPVLDICNFEVPDCPIPTLKDDILANYEHPFDPEIPFFWDDVDEEGLAENSNIYAIRLGLIGNSADEINHVIVNPTDYYTSVVFNLPLVLSTPGIIDGSTNNIPYSTIDGYPVYLNLYGSYVDDYGVGGTFEDGFHGMDGNDTFFGGDGNDLLEGDAGNDILWGEGDDDVIKGGSGMDAIEGGSGNDNIDGGTDDDAINGGEGDDCVEGGRGDDYIMDMYGNNLIFGNADGNPDVELDTDNDTIETGDGNDTIFGQDGNDYIDAGNGDNQVDGGSGDDTLLTGYGNDKVVGGEGYDFISSGDGDDEVCADGGGDTILAGSGNDLVDAGAGNDRARGNDGDDTILGGDGNDILLGDSGNDELAGGTGDDIVRADGGNDTIWYGAGTDVGIGGSGDDIFAFDDNGGALDDLGRNLVRDFTQNFLGADTIDFKCVEDLTHVSVIALDDDRVRLLGYADEIGATDGDFDELLFDVFVYGSNVGTINSAAGSLMQDSAYSSGYGPVCMNTGVLVDIGNTGDWDLAHVVTGGDTGGDLIA